MAMTYKVQQGDTLISIAATNGFRSWKRIWSDPKNEALRAKRANPQVLMPGDELFIPDLLDKPVDCATGKKHTFKLQKLPSFFSIRLVDETGTPYASAEYELEVEGKTVSGETDADGWISEEVPATAQRGRLKLWPDAARRDDVREWRVQIGTIDPVDTVSGVQGRLANLGYDPGGVSGVLDETTKQAIIAFQRHIGHPNPTGDLDDRTTKALTRSHNDH